MEPDIARVRRQLGRVGNLRLSIVRRSRDLIGARFGLGVSYASFDVRRARERQLPRWTVLGLACCLLAAFAAAACGGETRARLPSQAEQRYLAGRFAVALLHGGAGEARSLLVRSNEAALVFLVRRAAAPWRAQHADVKLPARRTGDRWTVTYEGTRTHADGRFETERGNLVVLVASSPRGAGVRFFGFTHVRTRFSTHHDSELLPSKR
jgi:hypothetical protein